MPYIDPEFMIGQRLPYFETSNLGMNAHAVDQDILASIFYIFHPTVSSQSIQRIISKQPCVPFLYFFTPSPQSKESTSDDRCRSASASFVRYPPLPPHPSAWALHHAEYKTVITIMRLFCSGAIHHCGCPSISNKARGPRLLLCCKSQGTKEK
ncbi:hypothetical protein CEXT_583461 [Caerostris extrusa]|uniref:Uncharacterized protein n=1 Tax=Caerostris extrusa TaxID=172846 RepID=A0AAV4RDG7_CAEEX|nr:hypothetical protein CEXT_583461 [Caerostris extrusa]